MENLDRPKNGGLFGEGEIVDADLVLDLLETYIYGKGNVPAEKSRSFAAELAIPPPENTVEMEVEKEDDDGSQGNKSIHEIISSASSNSGPITIETGISETGSNDDSGSINEPGSNEETNNTLLESNSRDIPNVENEKQANAEDDVIEEEEQQYDDEEEENSERSSSESEEKSTLEAFLAIQERYEIYCPSCSSCITRRVILKERNRWEDVDSSVDESSDSDGFVKFELPSPVKVLVPETRVENDDQEDKWKGVIFTCLKCLKDYARLGARFFLQLDYVKGKPVEEPVEVHIKENKSSNTTESVPQNKPDQEKIAVEIMKSTVYGGLTETITSLFLVSSASASGSSTENILALAVANLAGGLTILAQNFQDLRNNSDQEKDRYEELLGRRANFRMHILVVVLSYILFGLIPPLVYALSFYQTGTKNYKLVMAFLVSLVCVIMFGLIKVYVGKPVNIRESAKPYLKSAAYYTSIVVASSGIAYIVGDIMGKYIGKLGWFSLNQVGLISPFDEIKQEDRFTSSF